MSGPVIYTMAASVALVDVADVLNGAAARGYHPVAFLDTTPTLGSRQYLIVFKWSGAGVNGDVVPDGVIA